ncbi:MAG TPA: heme-degrading domain-containing protein, partial [Vicinamibacterales bacterium]
MGMMELVASIAQQEKELVFDRFDEHVAWQIGSLLRERAERENWPVVIDIRLFHRPLFFAALPGSAPDNVEWARRKRNVIERYHKSSYRVGREMALKGDTLANRYGVPVADFADHDGGFPITVRHAGVIGEIVVSGLEQQTDHAVIVEVLCTMLG